MDDYLSGDMAGTWASKNEYVCDATRYGKDEFWASFFLYMDSALCSVAAFFHGFWFGFDVMFFILGWTGTNISGFVFVSNNGWLKSRMDGGGGGPSMDVRALEALEITGGLIAFCSR